MEYFEKFFEVLYHPPSWIILVICAIYISEYLSKISDKFLPGSSIESKLIFYLEVIMAVVLAIVVLHVHLKNSIVPNTSDQKEVSYLLIFIFAIFVSVILYLIERFLHKYFS